MPISCRDDWSSEGRTLASETDLGIAGSGLVWGGEMGREDKEAGCNPLLAVRGGLGMGYVGYQRESSEQGNIHKSQAGKNKAESGWEQEVNGGKKASRRRYQNDHPLLCISCSSLASNFPRD